jgi:hypothetical protein
MAHDLFISYSSEDKVIADALCSALEVAKIRCWIAPRDILPGQEWAAAIVNAVAGSRVMVLIFSSNSKDSKHVKKELALAINSKVIVIPLKIDDIPFEGPMEYYLSDTHWLDAMNPPTEKEIQKLVETARVIIRSRDEETVSKDSPIEEVLPSEVSPIRTGETKITYQKKEISVFGRQLPLRALAVFAVIAIAIIVIVFAAGVLPGTDSNGEVVIASTQVFTETPAVTPTLEVTATSYPTVVPTATMDAVSTTVPDDNGMEVRVAPEGWHELQAEDISLWVPPSYIGGSPLNDLDQIMDELEALGSSFVEEASGIQEDPEKDVLWALDSEVGSSGIETTFYANSYFVLSSESSNDFLSETIGYMSESVETYNQVVISSDRLDIVRATIDYPGDIMQAMYALKDDEIADIVWMMVFTTHDSEFDERLEIFDQIVQSYGVESTD